MIAVTLMSPIKAGAEGDLLDRLRQISEHDDHPLDALEATHFARFALVDSLGPGAADVGRRILASTYLLFAAAVDGSFDDYLKALRSPAFAPTADAIWSHCVGYSATKWADRFDAYMRRCALPTRMFVGGYGGTVAEIRKVMHEREAVRDIVAEDLDDTELLDRFRGAFGGP